MAFKVRLIESIDEEKLLSIINSLNLNFDFCSLSNIYKELKCAFFVVLDDESNLVGWCGISYKSDNLDLCEIKDFYIIESLKDSTAKLDLLRMCNLFVEKYYKKVNIEISSDFEYLKTTLEELGYKIDQDCGNKTRYIYEIKKSHWWVEFIVEFFGELLAGVILIGLGALALLILPDKLTKNVDFEILILIGAIIMLGVPILIGLLIEFIRKRKGRKK